MRRVVEDRDIAEDLVGGEDRRDQALARHAEVWERRDLDRATLGFDLAQHALDLRVEQHPLRCPLAEDRLFAVGVRAAPCVGEEVEACILHDDRALEEVGQRAADLVHAFAVENDVRESAVDVERSLEAPVLGVDDPFEERRHQVDHLDIGADGENRNVEPVGLGHHLGRDLAHVGQRPHDQTRPT